MKISLVYTTRTGPVLTGLNLTNDRHVDLGYRIVQSGILGTFAKKHWSFAIVEAGEVKASIPMYKAKQVKPGLSQWWPRIPEREVAGSHRVLCEVLAENRSLQTREALRSALKAADEPELPVVGSEPLPDGNLTSLFTEAYEAWQAKGDGTPPPEIVHHPDGTTTLVTEWKENPDMLGGVTVVEALPGDGIDFPEIEPLLLAGRPVNIQLVDDYEIGAREGNQSED